MYDRLFLMALSHFLDRTHGENEHRDLSFVQFSEIGDKTFVTIEDYFLESLVVLISQLNQEGILFTCGIIYEKEAIVGLEVCIDSSDIEKLNERLF